MISLFLKYFLSYFIQNEIFGNKIFFFRDQYNRRHDRFGHHLSTVDAEAKDGKKIKILIFAEGPINGNCALMG